MQGQEEKNILQQKRADYEIVRRLIALISEKGGANIDLANFAKANALTKRQLNNIFERWCSLTPKEFMQIVAFDNAKKLLLKQNNILDVTNEIGLSSTSRLYDLFIKYEAMPPGIWAKRGEGIRIDWGVAPSPFGNALFFSTKYGLAALAFFDDGNETKTFNDLANRWPKASFFRNDEAIIALASKIFNRENYYPNEPIKIILIGSDFEIRVWETLLTIPFGKITNYGAIAKKINRPKATRSVGRAIGHNPISFIVPCHRVIGANGKLTGYHWGLNRKRAMLGWEMGMVNSGANCD